MNLLVAIVSADFDKINSQGERASYREKASLISESQHILSKEETLEYSGFGKFILYAKSKKLSADEELSSENQLKQAVEARGNLLELLMTEIKGKYEVTQKALSDTISAMQSHVDDKIEVEKIRRSKVQKFEELEEIILTDEIVRLSYENVNSPNKDALYQEKTMRDKRKDKWKRKRERRQRKHEKRKQ